MARQPSTTRRTVLGTIVALAATATAGVVSGDERDGQTESSVQNRDRVDRQHPVSTVPVPGAYDAYVSTVDRIVDDQHVVILLEEDGRTIDQLVVSTDRLPYVEERDHLLVLVDDEAAGDEERLRAAWPLPDRFSPR